MASKTKKKTQLSNSLVLNKTYILSPHRINFVLSNIHLKRYTFTEIKILLRIVATPILVRTARLNVQ